LLDASGQSLELCVAGSSPAPEPRQSAQLDRLDAVVGAAQDSFTVDLAYDLAHGCRPRAPVCTT